MGRMTRIRHWICALCHKPTAMRSFFCIVVLLSGTILHCSAQATSDRFAVLSFNGGSTGHGFAKLVLSSGEPEQLTTEGKKGPTSAVSLAVVLQRLEALKAEGWNVLDLEVSSDSRVSNGTSTFPEVWYVWFLGRKE